MRGKRDRPVFHRQKFASLFEKWNNRLGQNVLRNITSTQCAPPHIRKEEMQVGVGAPSGYKQRTYQSRVLNCVSFRLLLLRHQRVIKRPVRYCMLRINITDAVQIGRIKIARNKAVIYLQYLVL